MNQQLLPTIPYFDGHAISGDITYKSSDLGLGIQELRYRLTSAGDQAIIDLYADMEAQLNYLDQWSTKAVFVLDFSNIQGMGEAIQIMSALLSFNDKSTMDSRKLKSSPEIFTRAARSKNVKAIAVIYPSSLLSYFPLIMDAIPNHLFWLVGAYRNPVKSFLNSQKASSWIQQVLKTDSQES